MKKSAMNLLICVVCFGYCASAQPKIPKEKIPNDIAPGIKICIEQLYSSDPIKRAEGARWLTPIEEKGLQGQDIAIPFLIDILDDDAPLEWKLKDGGYILSGDTKTSPGKEAQETLIRIGRPSAEPLIEVVDNLKKGKKAVEILETVSGEKFGQDSKLWKEWWEKNKTNKLKIEKDKETSYFEIILFFAVIIVILVIIVWIQNRFYYQPSKNS